MNAQERKLSIFVSPLLLVIVLFMHVEPVTAVNSAVAPKEILSGDCKDNPQPSVDAVTTVSPNFAVLAEQILGTRPEYELVAEHILYGVRSVTTRYYTSKIKRGQVVFYCLGERFEKDNRFSGSAEKNVLWKHLRGNVIQSIVYYYDPQNDNRPLVAFGLNSKTGSNLNFSQAAFIDPTMQLDSVDEVILQQLLNKIDEINFNTKGQDKSFVIRNIRSLGPVPSYDLMSYFWGKRYVVGPEEPVQTESITEGDKNELIYTLGIKENRLSRLQVRKESRSGVLAHYSHVCVNYNLCQEVTGIYTEEPWSEIIYRDLNSAIIGRHTTVSSLHANFRTVTDSWFDGRGLNAEGYQVATADYQYDLDTSEVISEVLKIPGYYRWLYVCGEKVVSLYTYSCSQSSFASSESDFSVITPTVRDTLLSALKKVPGGTTIPLVVLQNYKQIDPATISFDLMVNNGTETKYSFINNKRQR